SPLPVDGAHAQKASDVRAGDEQHDASDTGQPDGSRDLEASSPPIHHGLMWTKCHVEWSRLDDGERVASIEANLGSAVYRGGDDSSTTAAHARAQVRDDLEPKRARIGVPVRGERTRSGGTHRYPDVDRVDVRTGEASRDDADDRVDGAGDGDFPAEYARVARELATPERVRDDGHRGGRMRSVLVGGEEAPLCRPYAQHVEEARC